MRFVSLPLIALGVHYAFPEQPWFLALVAPVPVLIYTLLLATTEDKGIWVENNAENKGVTAEKLKKAIQGIGPFTRTLLIAVGLTYAFMLFAMVLYNWFPLGSDAHTRIKIFF